MPELIPQSKQESNAGKATTTPRSIFDDVESKLKVALPDEDSQALWTDIRTAFEEGGPGAVKEVIDDRMQQLRRAVEKDLKQTRSVTKSATPKKKAPVKKAAASKKAVKK